MEKDLLTGRRIVFTDENSQEQTGIVRLVFTDALASGTNEYIPVTLLNVTIVGGKSYTVRPRNIIRVTMLDKINPAQESVSHLA